MLVKELLQLITHNAQQTHTPCVVILQHEDVISQKVCLSIEGGVTKSPMIYFSVTECLMSLKYMLTHCGRVTHICVGNQTIIGSDNGLSPDRRQAIIWTNAGILLIRPLGTNFNEMLFEILTFLIMKMRLNVSSAKWRPFCLGLNVLRNVWCL